MTQALLRLEGVQAGYGDLLAVRDVSLEVRPAEIVALVGSNGAGKTTTLRAICGLVPLRGGRVELDGVSIAGRPPSAVVAGGIAHVPEGRQLFPTMTVLENLELGAYLRPRADLREDLDRVYEIFPHVAERRKQLAGTLSGGEQQMVAMGRALMTRPKLMLMDEPSMGLAPILVERSFEIIKQVHEAGVALLVVEQNANVSLSIADRGYVLSTGRIVLEGKASELIQHDELRKAYLGR